MKDQNVEIWDKKITGKDMILAAAALCMGYFYVGAMFGFGEHSILSFLRLPESLSVFSLIFFGAAFWYGRLYEKKIEKKDGVFLCAFGLASFWFLICQYIGGQEMVPFMMIFLHAIAVFWLLRMTGYMDEDKIGERSLAAEVKGFFVLPFFYFFKLFHIICSGILGLFRNRKKWSRTLFQVLIGVALSAPLLGIILPMLERLDAGGGFTRSLWGILMRIQIITTGLFSIRNFFICIIASYLCGLFYGAVHSQKKTKGITIQLPHLTLMSFSAVFLVIYGLFFVSRLFAVPESMEKIEAGKMLTSTYARNGFFELCWIATINLAIFLFVRWFAENEKRTVKWILSVLGVETLMFVCLALSKMVFYISSYGWTFKRILTSWFMVVLFTAFTLLIVENWKKTDAIHKSVIFAVFTFLALAYMGI